MLKLAVTGGLASGKSTICLLFEKRGAYVVSADAIVHRLLSPQTSTGKKIIAWLGPEILEGENIDRNRVAARVFENRDMLSKLESLVHPEVAASIEEECQKAESMGAPLFVAEVPLLFEAGQEKLFDRVAFVRAPLDMRKKRYQKDDFEKRIAHQLSDEERSQRSDYIIENTGDISLVEEQVNTIFSALTKG